MQSEKQPFLIGWIAAFLRWVELLLFTISAPVLMAAACIAAVDILTGGALLASHPEFLIVFGVALAVGMDALLPAAWERVREAWAQKQWGTLVLWVVIGIWTGAVMFTALQVFGIEQAQHVTEEQALLMAGISPEQFQLTRNLLTIVLGGLSGFARVHQRPVGRAEERAYLEKELELEPLRQQLEGVKGKRLVGAVQTGKAVLAAARNTSTTPEPEPPAPAPDKPSGKRSQRRDIGRTVQETHALKERIAPKVVAMSAAGHPHQIIADMLGVTKFMVQQIIKEDKLAKGAGKKKKGAA